jgi:hypothetical protein
MGKEHVWAESARRWAENEDEASRELAEQVAASRRWSKNEDEAREQARVDAAEIREAARVLIAAIEAWQADL